MRGMLIKDKGKEGIVLTPDGLFVQGKIEETASLGEEVEVEPPLRRAVWPLVLAVAAAICFGLAFYRLTFPAPWSHVTVDVVPSVVVACDTRLRVTRQEALNTAAKNLFSRERLVGKELGEALSALLSRLRANAYLRGTAADLVFVTVTTRRHDDRLAPERLARLVASFLPAGCGGEIVVVEVDMATQQRAAKMGLSPGRYILLQKLARRGTAPPLADIREMPLRRLEQLYRFRVAALTGPEGVVLVLWGEKNSEKAPALLAAPVPPVEPR